MHATNFDYEKIRNSAEKEFPIRTTNFLNGNWKPLILQMKSPFIDWTFGCP
jgi:hypothetical protein